MLRSTFLLISSVVIAAAQQPSIVNANLQEMAAGGGLEAAVRAAMGRQPTAAWIGYAVATIPGDRNSCCWSNDARGCGLEGQRIVQTAAPSGPVRLEGPSHVSILLRVEQGVIGKVRSFSIDCPLDAGGLPFYWLTGVKNAESVALLVKHAGTGERAADSAVHAIAVHSGNEADAALERFATSAQSVELRRKAVFWLGNSRGKRGYLVLTRVLRDDASDKVREHAVFALTQNTDPEAVPTIVRIAKEDKSPRVRGQALFWLAQKAAKQAIGPIGDAIERDPENEVKKKAVFALTQMPEGEGVPALIQLVRTNQNPVVRNQAMFWLGQSKDPRALKFFEEMLVK